MKSSKYTQDKIYNKPHEHLTRRHNMIEVYIPLRDEKHGEIRQQDARISTKSPLFSSFQGGGTLQNTIPINLFLGP